MLLFAHFASASAAPPAQDDIDNSDYQLYSACCLYYLGQYPEAVAAARKCTSGGPSRSRLRNRVLMHCAHKLNNTALLDESQAAVAGAAAQNSAHDALAIAALQFMRCQYQEASDEYQRILKENMYVNYSEVYTSTILNTWSA